MWCFEFLFEAKSHCLSLCIDPNTYTGPLRGFFDRHDENQKLKQQVNEEKVNARRLATKVQWLEKEARSKGQLCLTDDSAGRNNGRFKLIAMIF